MLVHFSYVCKGSDWIRLVFAVPFPLNSGAPDASANFISDGKVQNSHDGACQTDGSSMIQDQRVGAIQSLSSLTLWLNENCGPWNLGHFFLIYKWCLISRRPLTWLIKRNKNLSKINWQYNWKWKLFAGMYLLFLNILWHIISHVTLFSWLQWKETGL